MNEPFVSVVVAAYNSEKYVCECIKSIQNQTYDNWEMIICDDCSTDKTFEIISNIAKEDSRIHVIKNNENSGAGRSRNNCLEICKGDYIMIQDADDVCENDRMQNLVKSLMHTTIDFVSSGHYLFDENGKYKVNIPQNEYPQKKNFLYGIPFCHAATMFKKECLIAVNGYRVSRETRRGQDYDMFMRLYAEGYRGKNIKDVLYGYRVNRDTIARRKFRYRIDECLIRYKGFKKMGILYLGVPFILKPIFAHFKQLLKGGRG